MIKIAFVGVEGSGKTWTTNFFAKKYNAVKTIEYGSWYCQNILNGYFKDGQFLTKKEDYIKIVEGQNEINNKALEKTNKICFFDTDYIFTKYFIDKQYVNWTWINLFVKKQQIDLFIFLKTKEITIKPQALITEDTIQNETYVLLNYYKKFIKTKLIIVQSDNYLMQKNKIEKIIEEFIKKNEKKLLNQY